MLQTFPQQYIFPADIPRASIALTIGNALPPLFCKQQVEHISEHLDEVFMSDIFDAEKRSDIMSKVKNKNTTQELFIKKLLCEMGYNHYRIKSPKLPCNPDISFPGKKKVIFINGCFWHGHDCKRGHLPESNRAFWEAKIVANNKRDDQNYAALIALGWSCLIIWQCEIKQKNIESLKRRLFDFLFESPI